MCACLSDQSEARRDDWNWKQLRLPGRQCIWRIRFTTLPAAWSFLANYAGGSSLYRRFPRFPAPPSTFGYFVGFCRWSQSHNTIPLLTKLGTTTRSLKFVFVCCCRCCSFVFRICQIRAHIPPCRLYSRYSEKVVILTVVSHRRRRVRNSVQSNPIRSEELQLATAIREIQVPSGYKCRLIGLQCSSVACSQGFRIAENSFRSSWGFIGYF